jgi:hypothetical protein
MKKLLTVLLVCFGLATYGQTTINPDTVCANATGEQYFVTNTPTSTYNWTSTNGVVTGNPANSITVDYSGVASGLYPNLLQVIESNAANCLGTPILLDVFVLDLSGNLIGPFCAGDPTTPLVGNPAGGTWTGTGVVANTFQPSTAGVGNYVLTYSMAGCTTTINVIVNTGPITGPIQHY